MANENIYQSEFTGHEMDVRFAAVAQLTAALEALTAVVAQKYVKPASGIPSTDLDADVNAALAKANSAIQSLADYYTKSEVDAMMSAVNSQEYETAATLPTASASTMGKIYLIGPDGSGYYSYYFTSYDGSAYSWVGPLGTTEINLAGYASKAELSQLDQELDKMTRPLLPADLLEYYDVVDKRISSADKWQASSTSNTFKSVLIPRVDVNGSVVKIVATAAGGNDTRFAFLTSNDTTTYSAAAYCVGTGLYVLDAGLDATLKIPSDCTYIYVCVQVNDINRITSIDLGTVWGRINKIDSDLIDIYEDLDSLQGDVKHNFVSGFVNGRGIDTDGTLSIAANRGIAPVKIPSTIAERIAFDTDGIIKSWNFYSGKPDTASGSNFLSPRYVTDSTGHDLPVGAKWVILMFDTSEVGPSYLYIHGVNDDGVDKYNLQEMCQVESLDKKLTGAAGSGFTKNLFVIAHITDTHAETQRNVRRYVDFANSPFGKANIDVLVHTGDVESTWWGSGQEGVFWEEANLAQVPLLFVVGNHDESAVGVQTGAKAAVYNRWIKPMVDNETLIVGSNVEVNDTFYFKDFVDYKIRLIVLNDYEPTYDAYYRDYTERTERSNRFGQEQADFLISTLSSTPAGYTVIIAKHDNENAVDGSHGLVVDNVPWSLSAGLIPQYAVDELKGITYYQDGRPLMDILHAYATKTAISKSYAYTTPAMSQALPDGVTVSADFTNAEGTFGFIICGHRHLEFIGHDYEYPELKQIVCANSGAIEESLAQDMGRTLDRGKSRDSFSMYVIDTEEKLVHIVKIGANFTFDGKWRNYTTMSYE